MSERLMKVYHITNNKFGNTPGQIPQELKQKLLAFKHETLRPQNDPRFSCTRSGYVPFDNNGRLLNSAKNNGIPNPSEKTPMYLVTTETKDGYIGALAVLHAQKYTHDWHLKLDYLCRAPGISDRKNYNFRGNGHKILTAILKNGLIPPKDSVSPYLKLVLNNASRTTFYKNFTKRTGIKFNAEIGKRHLANETGPYRANKLTAPIQQQRQQTNHSNRSRVSTRQSSSRSQNEPSPPPSNRNNPRSNKSSTPSRSRPPNSSTALRKRKR